jgi:hypothetical protein
LENAGNPNETGQCGGVADEIGGISALDATPHAENKISGQNYTAHVGGAGSPAARGPLNGGSKNPQKSPESEYHSSDWGDREDPDYMPAFVSDDRSPSADPSLENLSTTARATIEFARQSNLKLTMIGGRVAFDMPLWRKASPKMLNALYACEPEIAAWLGGEPAQVASASEAASENPQKPSGWRLRVP